MLATDSVKAIKKRKIISYEGFDVDVDVNIWSLSREHKVNLDWTGKYLASGLNDSFRNVLAATAQKHSAAHTCNQHWQFKAFIKKLCDTHDCCLSIISTSDLINYRATLEPEYEYCLGGLKGFLKRWFELGYGGIEDDVVPLLDSWRLRGNIKGRAVQTLCPKEGPLSDLEFEALHQALLSSFEADEVELEDFVLSMLFMVTGRRPAQLADVKVIDLIQAGTKGELCSYMLNIPRRKQQGVRRREQFKPYMLTIENGRLIQLLINNNKHRLYKMLNIQNETSVENFPLFPNWPFIKEVATSNQADYATSITSDACHLATAVLRRRLLKTISSLQISSERTGQKLRVFPTRLRRTLATRAAREGFGELVIAELLDHTDTQNVRVYTENVPEHVDAINEAVARQLAPLAQAFAGVLVNREEEAKRGDDLSSRVRTEAGTVGTCGQFGFCGALAPIACYTCKNFQPWLHGAHEEVLGGLIAERERILEVTQDKAMAAINDRTILAVTQVVQLCESRLLTLPGAQTDG